MGFGKFEITQFWHDEFRPIYHPILFSSLSIILHTHSSSREGPESPPPLPARPGSFLMSETGTVCAISLLFLHSKSTKQPSNDRNLDVM